MKKLWIKKFNEVSVQYESAQISVYESREECEEAIKKFHLMIAKKILEVRD